MDKLGLIRVYTKSVGERQTDRPLLLKRGARIIDLATLVHKDFVKFFDYAKLWRSGSPQPVRVGRNFELNDADTVEIHTS